jgi:hypothetical protein
MVCSLIKELTREILTCSCILGNSIGCTNVRFGSVAVVHPDTTRMSAFGSKADIECDDNRHKKARYKTGLSIFGSGGALYELYAD